MQLHFHKTELHLKETFSIAYGNYDKRDALVVKLSHLGKYGYGECVAINYYGINLEDFVLKLKEIQARIENQKIIHPEEFFAFLEQFQLHHFLLSALDCAYWDLFGKLENKSFSDINQLENKILAESSITVSIAEIDEQIRKIENSSWNKFKVKCNGFNLKNTEKLLNLNRNIALDANASFTKEDCLFIQETSVFQKLMYIEQPLEIGNFGILKNSNLVNWMADEDCQDITFLEKLKPHYSSINIKLMKCGGLTPALEMITEAKKLGYKIMLGCMTESSIGISAGCSLAGLLDFADLDGANLISNDYANGNSVKNGKIILSEKPGLGISFLG
ncbi:muconate cycloisomerase [Cloacibacterium rupense]|uniref:Muconate cycloisomerase n=1 Tax=Cloacibacterium rupense TaxID=517423 RepID=A0ABQ2NI29_9FLAO|nr:enolase C-terminal domain-like protein [Cloacibacterium rupense]GGP03906.1 muconate cycloisomerase [Cloacibacterium rupense]